MNKYTQRQKLGVIISATNTTGNEKMKKIVKLFEDEEYLNMQYYMEYCQMNGYVTPMEWIEKHKHF
jgi:maleate cis-trans isomerase